jgi:hypothetical protein
MGKSEPIYKMQVSATQGTGGWVVPTGKGNNSQLTEI